MESSKGYLNLEPLGPCPSFYPVRRASFILFRIHTMGGVNTLSWTCRNFSRVDIRCIVIPPAPTSCSALDGSCFVICRVRLGMEWQGKHTNEIKSCVRGSTE